MVRLDLFFFFLLLFSQGQRFADGGKIIRGKEEDLQNADLATRLSNKILDGIMPRLIHISSSSIDVLIVFIIPVDAATDQ